jgi:hypothetical protein
MTVIIAFSFVGNGLRDAADPFIREPPGATGSLDCRLAPPHPSHGPEGGAARPI